MNHKLAVIVAAGGSGERFGRAEGKQLAPVLGRPLVAWTLEALCGPPVDSIVLVCHPERVDEYASAAAAVCTSIPVVAVAGGDTRQASVESGLAHVGDACDLVAVHDGARPLVTRALLEAAISRIDSARVSGVVVGHPCYDTLKRVDGQRVVDTPDRSRYWVAQTPQVFERAALVRAYASAAANGLVGTDDASLVEQWGGVVEMLQGPRDNIKVTTADDLRFVEVLLRERRGDGRP